MIIYQMRYMKIHHCVFLLASFQFLFWITVPYIATKAPPLDAIESLIWGREWILGSHKHPMLPSWLIEIAFFITRSPILSNYLLSQLCVGITYFIIYLIAKRFVDKDGAAVAVFLTVPIVYFTWLSHEFNHNTIQLPIWAGAILLFLMIRERPTHALPWIGLGVVAGLGIHAKYSVLVLFICIAACATLDRQIRQSLLSPGPWLGAAVALLIAMPHLLWLAQNDFATLEYLSARSQQAGLLSTLTWLLVQVANHLPILIAIAFIGVRRIWALPRSPIATADLALVMTLGLGPAVVTSVFGLISGGSPRDMWGQPMFTLSGLIIVLLLARSWSSEMMARAFHTAIGFVSVTGVAFAITMAFLSGIADRPPRVTWPMNEIAEKMSAEWKSTRTDSPQVVAGPMWLAGLIAISHPDRPSVLYDANLSLSPWLTSNDLDDRTLYVWEGIEPPRWLPAEIVAEARIGSFAVSAGPRDGTVGFAVLPPPQD